VPEHDGEPYRVPHQRKPEDSPQLYPVHSDPNIAQVRNQASTRFDRRSLSDIAILRQQCVDALHVDGDSYWTGKIQPPRVLGLGVLGR